MLSPNYRYIALDFETTGLDLQSDEPIQIGILECDAEGNFIAGYQSLLRPSKPKSLRPLLALLQVFLPMHCKMHLLQQKLSLKFSIFFDQIRLLFDIILPLIFIFYKSFSLH